MAKSSMKEGGRRRSGDEMVNRSFLMDVWAGLERPATDSFASSSSVSPLSKRQWEQRYWQQYLLRNRSPPSPASPSNSPSPSPSPSLSAFAFSLSYLRSTSHATSSSASSTHCSLFSSFVYAYLSSRFPELRIFLACLSLMRCLSR